MYEEICLESELTLGESGIGLGCFSVQSRKGCKMELKKSLV